ncbi:hypothetical protein KUW04_06160 [Halomonas denitrificans]|nr:hypothetical protein [Halomonas denitrificans]
MSADTPEPVPQLPNQFEDLLSLPMKELVELLNHLIPNAEEALTAVVRGCGFESIEEFDRESAASTSDARDLVGVENIRTRANQVWQQVASRISSDCIAFIRTVDDDTDQPLTDEQQALLQLMPDAYLDSIDAALEAEHAGATNASERLLQHFFEGLTVHDNPKLNDAIAQVEAAQAVQAARVKSGHNGGKKRANRSYARLRPFVREIALAHPDISAEDLAYEHLNTVIAEATRQANEEDVEYAFHGKTRGDSHKWLVRNLRTERQKAQKT